MSSVASKARELVLRAGGLALMREIGRRAVRILLYHRFPSAFRETLERQCAHLRRHYNLVSLSDIDGWLHNGDSLPPNPVAVTIDDGYRDILEIAYPVFRSYRIPVTVFIATGFIDRECWLWVDKLAHMFQTTSLGEIEIPFPAGPVRYFLHSPESRAQAMLATKALLKAFPQDERLKFVQELLPSILKVTIPEEPPKPYQPLTWADIQEMNTDGFRFGAHTVTHPILSSLESRAALEREIVGSKLRLEEKLAGPVAQFSYPNGTKNDISATVVQTVERAGFASAVVADGSINVRPVHPYLLKRNAVEPSTPESVFGSDITGFRAVLRAGWRRAQRDYKAGDIS